MFSRLVSPVAGAVLVWQIFVAGFLPTVEAATRLTGASVVGSAMPLSVGNATADAVLGQPNFTSPTCNNPVLTSNQQLCHPVGVALDPRSERLLVSDGDNNRMLIWPDAQDFANGQAARVVLGQPNFTINQKCSQTTTAHTLCDPNNLTVDTHGNLFVADTDGNRVLEFSPPFSNGMSARLVLGQPGFDSKTCVTGSAHLCAPRDVALDADGNLYVADADNNRVLEYTSPLTNEPPADRVFGQPNFTAAACTTSASGLCAPHRVAVDASGQLLVSDTDNNRVLGYSHPLSSSTADVVFGQPNFTSHIPTTSATGLAGPQGIAIGCHGDLYLSDEDNTRVLWYDNTD